MLYRTFDKKEFPEDKILSKAEINEWCEYHGKYKKEKKNARLPLTLWNRGFHLMEPNVILNWLGSDIYVLEYDNTDEFYDFDGIVVARRVRKIGLANWDDRIARLFAAWCAEQVKYLNANAEQVIEIIKNYANGLATKKEKDDAILGTNFGKEDSASKLALGAAFLSGDDDPYLAAMQASTLSIMAEYKDTLDDISIIIKKRTDQLSLVLENGI